MGEAVNQDMILGEMRGQIREMVHQLNNLSAKMDAMTREVIALGPLASEIGKLDARVSILETARNKQDGALGVFATVFRSPALGWLVGGASALWLIIYTALRTSG